jgi:phosphoglycolate phosphatase-like HAD superfamily hydrolase
MRRYQVILLDVDGTLIDSNDAHAHAWVEALEEHGVGVAHARVQRLIGMGGDQLIELVADLPRDTRANARLAARRSVLFRERWLGRVRPFPRVREFLQRLDAAGYRRALATAARDEELAPLLALGDIADLCDARASSSDVRESKPAPDIVEAALAALAVPDRSRAVLVGDTEYDAFAARAAGIDFLHVSAAARVLLGSDTFAPR